MENPLIVANWKMNPQTTEEAKTIALSSDRKGVVICPPFAFIKSVKERVKKAEIGAQNCFSEKKGAFTGETSPVMLKKLGCRYVIIGHSERREYFGENNNLINKKIKVVLKEGLTPILCIGEMKKDTGGMDDIKEQLVEGVGDLQVKKIIIAYEPIFAIGTNLPCDVEEAEKKKVFIKNVLAKNYSKGEQAAVLYGGSVNSKNASSYIKKAGFQGLLVGGASLKIKEMKKIIENVYSL